MAKFGNYQNEKRNEKNKLTRARQLYNKEQGSTLVIEYFNESFVLKIHPTLPVNKQSKSSIYDYDIEVSSYILPLRLLDLNEIIKNISSNIVKGEEINFEPSGISSGDGFIEFAPANVYGYETDAIAITIYNGIDAEGEAQSKLTYVFNKSNYYKNYATNKQDYETSDKYESEFKYFALCVSEALKASTHAMSHSIRYQNRYSDSSIFESLKALKEKAGIISNYNNNNNHNTTTYFGSKNNSTQTNENVGTVEDGGYIVNDRLPL